MWSGLVSFDPVHTHDVFTAVFLQCGVSLLSVHAHVQVVMCSNGIRVVYRKTAAMQHTWKQRRKTAGMQHIWNHHRKTAAPHRIWNRHRKTAPPHRIWNPHRKTAPPHHTWSRGRTSVLSQRIQCQDRVALRCAFSRNLLCSTQSKYTISGPENTACHRRVSTWACKSRCAVL